MSELTIRQAIISALVSKGAWVVTTTGVSAAGTPDLLACYKGKFIALEVKDKHGRPTRLQVYTLKTIEDAGGTARLVRSVKEAIECLTT